MTRRGRGIGQESLRANTARGVHGANRLLLHDQDGAVAPGGIVLEQKSVSKGSLGAKRRGEKLTKVWMATGGAVARANSTKPKARVVLRAGNYVSSSSQGGETAEGEARGEEISRGELTVRVVAHDHISVDDFVNAREELDELLTGGVRRQAGNKDRATVNVVALQEGLIGILARDDGLRVDIKRVDAEALIVADDLERRVSISKTNLPKTEGRKSVPR
jgi:hypothetical protein